MICSIEKIKKDALKSFLNIDFSKLTSKKFNLKGEMFFEYTKSKKYHSENQAMRAAESINKKITPKIEQWATEHVGEYFKTGFTKLLYDPNNTRVVLKYQFPKRLETAYLAKFEKQKEELERSEIEDRKEISARLSQQEFINKQEEERLRGVDVEQGRGEFLQKTGGPVSSIASPKTISTIKDFLKRIGVNISDASKDIIVDGIKQDANGAALLTQRLVQVAQGAEAHSLPEEAMHFAVAIIKQTNPTLYKKLLSEINKYAILNDVFEHYGDDPLYQTSDGKRDVIKLKEEAIGKVLAETIIRNKEGATEKPELLAKVNSWWDQMLEWLKGLFSRSGFDTVTMDIIAGKDIGTAEDIKEKEGTAFLQKDVQSRIVDDLIKTSATIELRKDGYYRNGIKIRRRVSDIVKDWYDSIFNDIQSDYAKAVAELKAEKGTAGHKAKEYAFKLFVDDNGYLRKIPLEDNINDYVKENPEFDYQMYKLLKDNLQQRLNSFPEGTRFMSELRIYDAKRDLAGTVDFLAVEPQGKVNVLDWKFMGLDTTKYEDIPWYKVAAWQRQMNQYKLILEKAYGIKSQDFGQTRMIPIFARYTEGDAKQKILPRLIGIKIGDVNVNNIQEDYLLPVGLEGEKTGDKRIDKYLERLNGLYKRLSETKVLPSEKANKAEQLNALFKSIRQLQIRKNAEPLVQQAKILNQQVNRLIKQHASVFNNADPKSFSQKYINDFSEQISTAKFAIETYTNLTADLKSLFKDDLSKEDEKLKNDLRETSERARDLKLELIELEKDHVSEVIAKREDVKDNYLDPEKIVRGFSRWFSTTSTMQIKGVELIYKLANKAMYYIGVDTLEQNKKLDTFRDNFKAWASAKGLSPKNMFDILKKKNQNELIDQYDSKFYSELKQKIGDKNLQWIQDNIDHDKYQEFLKDKLEKEYERIELKYRFGTEEEVAQEILQDKQKAANLYNISTPMSKGWLLYNYTKKFPKDSWESKEWKELTKKGNEPAKAFYDYIIERNEEYAELGYINNPRTFLPFMRRSLVEKLFTGGKIKVGEQLLRNISIDEGDVGYGQIDPDTGKPINSVPKYFTKEIEGEVSTDLFKNMALYNEAAIKYKHLSEIDEQARSIAAVERNKEAIATSFFGRTERKDGEVQRTKDNSVNSKLVEDMIEAIIYGKKYLTSETFDQVLGKIGNWGETLNKKLGTDIFPEGLSGRQISINKVLDTLNNTFQINTMGLNFLSAGSNYFGGNAQSLINAGTYFTKIDYTGANFMVTTSRFSGTNQKLMLSALEYFLPLTEDYNREIAKHLSVHNMTAESLQDGLMYFMKKSDWNVQMTNFYAYLKNTIVENGELVNARVYLREQSKYANKYEETFEERKNLEEQFEKDVAELIDKQEVLKLAKVIDNKFVIPGVVQKSQSVINLRRTVQSINKNALGNLSADDLRRINMNIYGRSMMVFHNWIPRLIDVRTGNLKYNNASDAYEWGRVRSVYRMISEDFSHSLSNLYNSLAGNDKGIAFVKDLYEKKKADYENDTGKVLRMTEDQFIDLTRQNLKNQLYDAIFLATMYALFVALKAYEPTKEEDPAVRAQYRFMLKAVDKLRDELTYFYDPTSLAGLISSGPFPAMTLITNFMKALKNFGIENFALATGDEKLEKSNMVIKYWMKTFPFTNQMSSYLPMFYPQLAKDLGLKIQSNYGIR